MVSRLVSRLWVWIVLVLLIGCIVYADFATEFGTINGDFVLDYSSSSFDKRIVHNFEMYANATTEIAHVTVVDPNDKSLHRSYEYKKYYFEIRGKRVFYIAIKHQYNVYGSSHHGLQVLTWAGRTILEIYRPQQWYYRVKIYDFNGSVIDDFTKKYGTSPAILRTFFKVLDDGRLNIIFKQHTTLVRNITIDIPPSYLVNLTFKVGVAIHNEYCPSYAGYKYTYVNPNAYFERISMFMRGFEVVSSDFNVTVINNFVDEEMLSVDSGVWGISLDRVDNYYVLKVCFLNGINMTLQINVDESDLYVSGRTTGNVSYFVRFYRKLVRQYTRFTMFEEFASYLLIGILALIPLILGDKGFVMSLIWVVGVSMMGVIPFWIGFITLFLTIIYVGWKSGVF